MTAVWTLRGAVVRIISARRARHAEEKADRVSQEEIRASIARGEDRTDGARVDRLTEAGLEAVIAADPDAEVGPINPQHAVIGLPPATRGVHLRLDSDIVDWFKTEGKGYQRRINAVLRAYVRHRRHPQR
jgi:uncharacterized protein (DUF4415 family)